MLTKIWAIQILLALQEYGFVAPGPENHPFFTHNALRVEKNSDGYVILLNKKAKHNANSKSLSIKD